MHCHLSNDQIIYKNKFGIELVIEPEKCIYQVFYKGQNWLGKGMISILEDEVWFRNLCSPRMVSSDLTVLSADIVEFKDDKEEYSEIRLLVANNFTNTTFNLSIKFYFNMPYLIFNVKYPENNTRKMPYIIFPQFLCSDISNVREDLSSWVPGFMGFYEIKHNIKASEGFVDPNRFETAIPLVLFDRYHESMVLSPYSNYLVSNQYTEKPGGAFNYGFGGDKLINCGLNRFFSIPDGFEHSTILFFGSGINNTINDYGEILLKKSGKRKPCKYNDDTISYLSYWVDFGSYYCQNWTDNGKYDTFEEVIIELAKDAEKNGLIIKSWEVQDGDQNKWTEGLFEIREDLVPNGLNYLGEKVGKPLYSYYSPIEPGPYREKYPYIYTGHVAYGGIGSVGMGDLFYTEEYWDDQVRKVKEWGSEGLQHDFLSNYWNTPKAVNYIERYMKSMAKACLKYQISVQYCMCFSNHILETTENMASVSLQGIADHYKSEKDGGCGKNLKSFIYSSTLYGALGLWPARDNIQTNNDADAYEDLLVANLSGGPIQLGHEIGKADIDLLKKTFREGDGLILKPDRPISPIDKYFLENDGFVACTATKNEIGEWKYVLSLNIGMDNWDGGSFTPYECGGTNDKYIVYDYNEKKSKIVKKNEVFKCLDKVKSSYYVLAPILPGGITIIGDITKFITMADERIKDIKIQDNNFKFSVLSGGNGNYALVAGYSSKKPLNTFIDDIKYDRVDYYDSLDSTEDCWYWEGDSCIWYIKITYNCGNNITAKKVNIIW